MNNVFEDMLSDKQGTIGKVITEPTLLSDCGELATLDTKDIYNIAISKGEFQVITMGFSVDKPAIKFEHSSVITKVKTIHEFKHYRSGGGKFWTSRAGMDIVFIVPRNKIKLLPEKGYSYIRAEINGVKVSFNVSGGGGGAWTDYLTTWCDVSCNHPLRDVKKIAEVAIRNEGYEKAIFETLAKKEPINNEKWERLAANRKPELKEKIYELIEKGKNPVIHLNFGWSFNDGGTFGTANKLIRGLKKYILTKNEKGEAQSWEWKEDGKVKSVICGYTRVKVSHINWYKTIEENKGMFLTSI